MMPRCCGCFEDSKNEAGDRAMAVGDGPLRMKCFVTGATGFLGSHVARQLLARGAKLRLLVRPTSRNDNIADLAAERVTGDLRDADSLRRGMAGCQFVFHVAADYRL